MGISLLFWLIFFWISKDNLAHSATAGINTAKQAVHKAEILHKAVAGLKLHLLAIVQLDINKCSSETASVEEHNFFLPPFVPSDAR